MRAMRIDEIGGARVLRVFQLGDRRVMAGTEIDAQTLSAMPAANRNSLIENRYIHVWPRPATVEDPKAERHVVHLGRGQFNVIEGRLLNDAPLSKEDADQLAGAARKH